MAIFQNCKVGDVQSVTVHSGDVAFGYGFGIQSDNRPVVYFSFATEDDAKQARIEVAKAVEKAIEVTPQG
jgi:hypothetical protein